MGNGGGIQVNLTAPGAGKDQASQPCSGPSGSSPTPATPYQRQGQDNEVCQGCPCSFLGACGSILLPSSSICFTTSPPLLPPLSFQLGHVPLWEEEDTPTRATGSGVLPTERLLGQRLCPVPYQPWGEDIWLEDWNLIAIIFDL